MSFFFELIKKRRSIRKYTTQVIEQEKKDLLIKSALLAPTSKRSNSSSFILIEDKKVLEELSKSRPHGSQFLAGASLAIVVLGNPEKSDVWVEDASIAATYIQLQAESLGLGSCWIQVRKRMKDNAVSTEDVIKKLLLVPKNYKVLNIIAIGYKMEEKKAYTESDLSNDKVHFETYNKR